jgi:hypothetical protein
MKLSSSKTDVIFENFGDEVVLINMATGVYYSLEGSAREIWDMLGDEPDVDVLTAAFATRHGLPREAVGEHVRGFFMELLEQGLVASTEAAQPDPASPAAGLGQDGWPEGAIVAPPVLRRYTDMQNLLLLDPIHDVDESGWPRAKPDPTAAE